MIGARAPRSVPPVTDQTIVITGAAGLIGGFLRERMRRDGRVLRLVDIAPIPDVADGEEAVQASITDAAAMTDACAGASAVVHLAGIVDETDWEPILRTNIDGTWHVLDAARAAGVRRVVIASSNHAVGFTERGAEPLPDTAFPRPDTHYGVSKVAKEALGSLYVDRHGMDVVCLRIGTCVERPRDRRALSTWLSPDDTARLVEASLAVPQPGFRVVWGVSANTRRWWSDEGGAAIGYHPVDDAEAYAADIEGSDEPDDAVTRVGGPWARPAAASS